MQQGRLFLALGAALALMAAPHATHAATSPDGASKTPASATRSRNSLRQFTGYVTALDRSSLTVEKRGRSPRTMTFTRDAEMETSGAVEKEARVTVYYRDEDGHAVAHRVVGKVLAPRSPKPSSGSH